MYTHSTQLSAQAVANQSLQLAEGNSIRDPQRPEDTSGGGPLSRPLKTPNVLSARIVLPWPLQVGECQWSQLACCGTCFLDKLSSFQKESSTHTHWLFSIQAHSYC